MIYRDLLVVDLTTGIAGGYCAKVLTELGADVVKLEHPDGDPLRRWSPSGSVGRDGWPDSAVFRYLHASQRSVRTDAPTADGWLSAADIVLRNPDSGPLPATARPAVTVVISALGASGPEAGRDLPEPLLQARCGVLSNHGQPDRPPVLIDGRLGEFLAGAYAALGAMTAWYRAARTGRPETVDVSTLEAMQQGLLSAPTLRARFPGGSDTWRRVVQPPGCEPTGDGRWIGITCVTPGQWRGLLEVMGRTDLWDDEEMRNPYGRARRIDEVNAVVRAWTCAHTADEVIAACRAAKVPSVPLLTPAELVASDHLTERGVFGEQPDGGFPRPRFPVRFAGVEPRVPTPAPAIGEHDADAVPARVRAAAGTDGPGERPFAGVRVLDFTAFWAGPVSTSWLAAMGADVAKVESPTQPDGIRTTALVPVSREPRALEMSSLFALVNLDKRGLTVDVAQERERVDALLDRSDLVATSFTPRALEKLGLTPDRLREGRPDLITCTLTAYGATGPWRELPGFAQTVEEISGMAWLGGYPPDQPVIPGGVLDPMSGVHTAIGMVAALDHRERTGEALAVEVAMLEVALAVNQVEFTEQLVYGQPDPGRPGETPPGPHVVDRRGQLQAQVHRCAGTDEWVVIDRGADRMDEAARRAWCLERSAADAVAELTAAGIPASPMVPAHRTTDDPQLQARGYFEPVEHPVVGLHDYPRWPMLLSAGPARWWHAASPLIGQHTEEVLAAWDVPGR